MTMQVGTIRRYPVKSMGGEHLKSVALDDRGLVGDRWFAVIDADGHLASGKNSRRFRRRDAVFEYAARTVSEDVLVSGAAGEWTVGDPALDAHLSDAMCASVRVLPERSTPHQDAGSVSLVGTATLDWFAREWGIDADPRRLRVNLVVETDEPFVEETWVDRRVTIGGVTLLVVDRVPRCRMIDLAQDGATGEGRWLKPLAAERQQCAAMYADVLTPGEIRVGDVVDVDRGARPTS